MKLRTPLLLSTAMLVALTACVDSTGRTSNQNTAALAGGLLGAGIGAASARGGDRLLGATIGGILGTAAGGIVGASLDKQAADLRRSIATQSISVTNFGSYLLVRMPQDVLFDTGSAVVNPRLIPDLLRVGGNLVDYPASSVEVVGHTDNTGSAELNQRLSERRAASVAQILVNGGLQRSRVLTVGRGEDEPIASNLTAQGRAQNRRVDVIIRPN